MTAFWRFSVGFWLSCLCALQLQAGGSGLNVVVVVNQSSSNSLALGNYYCEKRQVPPQNVLRINWNGGNTNWSFSDLSTNLWTPLLAMVSARQLTNQIDYVVLSMDIPYRVFVSNGDVATDGINSTTATLFYGFKPDGPELVPGYPSCSLPDISSNSYAGSEAGFRDAGPTTAPTNSFLTMMLTSSTLEQAKSIVDRGVASDASFPVQPVILAKTSDVARNVRYVVFDNALMNTLIRGSYVMFRTNSDTPYGLSNLLGYQTGLAQFAILPNSFVAGALADSLTSFAGYLFDPAGQTTLLAFLDAGATGSYGTIFEPCNYLEKFPSPQTYFYQSRGFNVAESYYQGLTNPYQGLLVGEPLSAPFSRPPLGAWVGLPSTAVLQGLTNLSVQFSSPDATRPIQKVDLFVDGQWFSTLTNIPPGSGNLLSVVINGQVLSYVVPAAASIRSVAGELSSLINVSSNTNVTQVIAFAHGDRIELHSIDVSKTGEQLSVIVSNSPGAGSPLTTFVSAALPQFLDTIAYGNRGFAITGNPTTNSYLQCVLTKLNSTQITLGVTNTTGSQSLTQIAQQLLALINSNTSLQRPDGLTAEDFITDSPGPTPPEQVEFYLVANSPGWNAAQLHVSVSCSSELTIQPTASGHLDMNLSDLQPRNHLYITAGATNLLVTTPVDTTTLPDGFHELTAVAYEGSSVQTQLRVSQPVQIKNSTLSATLSCSNPGTNVYVGGSLQFSVVANTNEISSIQLYSTGGLVGAVTNQPSATFSVTAGDLGLGLHPFYALVSADNGSRYRTETLWFSIGSSPTEFPLSITNPPTTLSWPAVPGTTYDVLSTTNLQTPFQLLATVLSTNSQGVWVDTNPAVVLRFYRVRTSN